MDRNNDLVTIIRRNKITGFAIASLFDKHLLKSLTEMSRLRRLVDHNTKYKDDSFWYDYEVLSTRDAFSI